MGAQVNETPEVNDSADYPEKALAILEDSRSKNGGTQVMLDKLLLEAKSLESIGQFPHLLAQIYLEIFSSYRKLRTPHLGTPYLTKVAELIHEYGTNEANWLRINADFFAKRAHALYWEYKTDEAIIEMEKALKFYKQLKNDFKIGISLNGLGVYYSEKGKSEKSIEFYDEAYTHFIKCENETWQLRSQFCKSVDLIVLEKYEEAKDILLSILPRLEETKHVNHKFAISKLGQIEMKLGNLEEAEKLMVKSVNWSIEKNNHNSIVSTSRKLLNLYTQQNDDTNALKYSRLISAHQDSLLSQFNEAQNMKAQDQLEVFEQKQIVKNLEFQRELEQSQFKSRLISIIGFFSLLLGMVGFWIYRQRAKRRQALVLQSKVEEVQQVRENLLSAVTHELRTPLTLIVGQIEELQKGTLNKSDQKITKKLDRHASDLLAQIDQLLHWKRTEAKAMVLNPSMGDASSILKEVFQTTRNNFESKNLNWSYSIFPEKLTLEMDFEKLKIIVSNLLSNAGKYTSAGGFVKLYMNLLSENKIEIKVEDNGIGIPSEMKNNIFNWYERVQQSGVNNSTGFGVGLALSKALSKVMKGDLSFTSIQGKGSTFTLVLPIKKITDTNLFVPAKVAAVSKSKEASKSKHESSCLIIEDHVELNEYLSSFLSESFEIYTALDAAHGLKLAIEHLPDIIISDQMLPGKSGLELCKELKEHILTDHIPIVILTALNNEAIHHDALKNRADGFITKPFKQEELLLTINNLIQNRRRLKIRFQRNDPVMKLKKDDPFIKLMISNIEANFSDSSYNVDALAKNLKISRAQLSKKSKALIDCSPSALIKQHRLDQAKKSLEQGGQSVSETAYDCGFSSPEYFSTVFKEHFKKRPKDFLKK